MALLEQIGFRLTCLVCDRPFRSYRETESHCGCCYHKKLYDASRLTADQKMILEQVDAEDGVPPNHFVGKGYVVASMVRRGWLQWERGKMPKSLQATALLITDAGRAALKSGRGN